MIRHAWGKLFQHDPEESNMTTIDTAIAAWTAATTEAERDCAAAAIEEHIAHETPEGADYVAATDEFLTRLRAEYGPVPIEDLRDLPCDFVSA